MAISYVSQVSQDTSYILPVDLELMGKVNQYKQTQFYKNAASLKQGLSQIKNADILNEQQKERLNEGYNQLASKLQNAGALDYSDLNVVSSIESLGSQIYEDKAIISGIVSTKNVRKLHSIYEKFKSDPKYMKNYSIANEYVDNLAVTDYINGGVDATYKGSGTPTVYLGNTFEYLSKNLKDLKPNISTSITNSGDPYYFDKTTNTVLQQEDIIQILGAKMTPEWRNQTNNEALYESRNAKDDDIKTELGARYTSNINSSEANIKRLEGLSEISTSKEEKAAYADQIVKQKNYILEAQERHVTNMANIDKTLVTREGRAEVLGTLYRHDIFNNIAGGYSYEQTKKDLQLNTALIHKEKLAMEAQKMAQQNKQFYDGLAWDKEKEANKVKAAKEAKDKEDGIFPDSPNVSQENNMDTPEEKAKRMYTAENIDGKIADLYNEESSALLQLFNRTGGDQYNDFLSEVSGLDGNPMLSSADIDVAFDHFSRKGGDKDSRYMKAAKYYENIKKVLTKGTMKEGFDPKDLDFNLNEALESVTNINNITTERKWAENNRAQANKAALTKLIGTSKKLNSSDLAIIQPAINNMSAYFTSDGEPKNEEGRKMLKVFEKTGNVKYDVVEDNTSAYGYLYGSNQKTLALDMKKIDRISNDEFYKKENNNTNVHLLNSVYLNYKLVDKNRSDIQAYLSKNKLDGEEILPDKIVAIDVQIPPSYKRPNGESAIINFKYTNAAGKVKSDVRTLNSAQMKSIGLQEVPLNLVRQNETLHTTRKLDTDFLKIPSWTNGKSNQLLGIGATLIKNADNQIEYQIINPYGDIIKLKKIPDPQTGKMEYFSTSYEAKEFLKKYAANIQASGLGQKEVFEYLQRISIYDND